MKLLRLIKFTILDIKNVIFIGFIKYHSWLLPSLKNTSLYRITCGQRMDAKILTSLKAFYFSFSDNSFNLTYFKAYSWLSTMRLTLYTQL